MLICDRCNKKAVTTLNIAGRSRDVCPRCLKEFDDIIEKFLSATDINLKSPDKAPDPIEAVVADNTEL